MTIRVTNSAFESVDSDTDFGSIDEAYTAAVKAGLDIAANEVSQGALSAIVEVAVDVVGRRNAARGAVAVTTARLLAVE